MNLVDEEEDLVEVDDYESGLCSKCGCVVGLFRDYNSEREYAISGMCQACQDEEYDIEHDIYGTDY